MSQRRILKTLCNRDCPDVCQILVHLEGDRAVRLQGDPEHPITRGFLCPRTNKFLSLQYGKERLTTPLLRKGGGLEAVGRWFAWDWSLTRGPVLLVARSCIDEER
jgi:anaerobic selenocysteine-containing dehydrogenase